jgi:hypothetical protein
MVVPEMHFAHPETKRIPRKAFPPSRQPGAAPDPGDLREHIKPAADELKAALATFVDRFAIDILFPQNALAIPMHIPLGVALTEFIAETGIPTIAHHHDLYWERARFATTVVPDILARCFPPDLPSVRHVVISCPPFATLSSAAWLKSHCSGDGAYPPGFCPTSTTSRPHHQPLTLSAAT